MEFGRTDTVTEGINLPCTQTQFSTLSNCLRSLNIVFIYPAFAKWGGGGSSKSLVSVSSGKRIALCKPSTFTSMCSLINPFFPPHSQPQALEKSSVQQKTHKTSHLINRYQKITALSVSNDPFMSPVGPVKKSNSKAKNNLRVRYFGLSLRLLFHIEPKLHKMVSRDVSTMNWWPWRWNVHSCGCEGKTSRPPSLVGVIYRNYWCYSTLVSKVSFYRFDQCGKEVDPFKELMFFFL